MKRLLAYLIIVFGLGLVFSVNAEEVIYEKKLNNFKNLKDHLGTFYGIIDGKFRVRGLDNIDVNGKVLYPEKVGSAWVGTFFKNKTLFSILLHFLIIRPLTPVNFGFLLLNFGYT